MGMTVEDYRKVYFKRFYMKENAASTATRLTQHIDNWAYDYSKPPAEEDIDDTVHEL